jgi:type IX secretion system PorP/SprF family membrane protein
MRKHLQSIRYLIIVALLVSSVSTLVQAQDPMFSQHFNNPIYYNPAYIGLNSGIRARLNYRDQWVGLPQGYKTFDFTMDMAERSIPGSGGLGLIALTDQAGAGQVTTTQFGLGSSARVPLTENMLAQVGFTLSYVQKSIDWSKMVFTDQLHPRYGVYQPSEFEYPETNTVRYPDISLGAIYRFSQSGYRFTKMQGTIGLGVHHVFEPNESFIGQRAILPPRWVIHGDIVFDVESGHSSYNRYSQKGSFKFNPGFMYEKQRENMIYSFGVNVLKSNVYLGVWFRNQSINLFEATDAIFMAGVYAPFNKESRIKLQYSYDYVIYEPLNLAGKSSHEISIVFEFDEFSLFGGGASGIGDGYRRAQSREMDCCPF